MKHLVLKLALAAGFFALFSACGGGDSKFPSTQRDYAKMVNGRAMVRMWDVILDIEETGGEEITVTPSGTPSAETEAADAEIVMEAGNVNIQLKTTGSKAFAIKVNGKSYGRVIAGNQVKITKERDVFVNSEPREPK